MTSIASQTFLIVGLGNPGKEHHDNRHNVGFMLIDLLAEKLQFSFSRRKSKSRIAEGYIGDQKVILVKPHNFMNLSGHSVSRLVRFFKVPLSNILVAYDELDLPLESIRIRPSGGSGGHKGMQSIIQQVGSPDFPRLRIGIGRPPGRMDPADFVLQDFTPGEKELIDVTLHQAVECIQLFVSDDLDAAMTCCN
jgi:PTH1 family peptidyl-tRNA hydrolase